MGDGQSSSGSTPDRVRVLTHHSTPSNHDWREVRLDTCTSFGSAGPITDEWHLGGIDSVEIYRTADGCWFFVDANRDEGGFLSLDQAEGLFRKANRVLPYELGGIPTTTTPPPPPSKVTLPAVVTSGSERRDAYQRIIKIFDDLTGRFEDRLAIVQRGALLTDGWAGTSSFSPPKDLIQQLDAACKTAGIDPQPLTWIWTDEDEVPEEAKKNGYWAEWLKVYEPDTGKGSWFGLVNRHWDESRNNFAEWRLADETDQLARLCQDIVLKLRAWLRTLSRRLSELGTFSSADVSRLLERVATIAPGPEQADWGAAGSTDSRTP